MADITEELVGSLKAAQKEISELQGVISKLSKEKNELARTVGGLNRDVANNRDSIKALQGWAKDQNDQSGRKSYASTSRY